MAPGQRGRRRARAASAPRLGLSPVIQELFGRKGLPSLGYDVKDKKLIVNEAEATTVRYIFRRYTELKSVRLLKADLDTKGIVSKAQCAADGTRFGEKPLARGALYLQNRIYCGEIVHKGKSHPGEHEAIIDDRLWSEVQLILQENRSDRILGTSERQVSLLSGILFDARGERMTPTYSMKNGARYRYYVSRSLMTGSVKDSGQRIPAAELEPLVRRRIRDWLADRAAMIDMVQNHTSDGELQKRLIVGWERAVASWPDLGADEIRAFVVAVVPRIQVHADRVEIVLDPTKALRSLTQAGGDKSIIADLSTDGDRPGVTLTVAARLSRAGKEMRIIVAGETCPQTPDSSLIRVLVRGHEIRTGSLQTKA
jgi:site-specific DNA recombinase